MSTPFLGVVIRITLGAVLTAVSVVPSVWAQSAGDIVIVGSSPAQQSQLRTYWNQLLQLNVTTEAEPVKELLPQSMGVPGPELSGEPLAVPQAPRAGRSDALPEVDPQPPNLNEPNPNEKGIDLQIPNSNPNQTVR